MPVLHITLQDGERHIPFAPGLSVREILDIADIIVRSACGGVGACGLCRIRIEAGKGGDPTANELINLSPDQIQRGIRLACQIRPLQDIRIAIETPAPTTNWRSLSEDEYNPVVVLPPPVPTASQDGISYGVAVDLGTTQIRLSLWDLEKGRRLAGRSGLNPQARFGADVLTRLAAASESEGCAREISRLARETIREALQEIATEAGRNLREIRHLVIVGNTSMLTLLSGKNYHLLLQTEYWTREIDCQLEDPRRWCLSWGLDAHTRVDIASPLGGFVGSDLLAGVLATQLTEGPTGALLIDFGTNSEIALWDSTVLWVTSAAGGPAFEGWGLSCGMPAEPGAIYRMELQDHFPEFLFKVVGGRKAKGLCGSGLVDLITLLIKSGILKSNGKFAPKVADQGFFPLKERRDLVLKKRDVDVFQRAKAAIGAGTECLMKKAGMHLEDIKRICVCGAFGRFLNVANAQDLGLLPCISGNKVELCGNTALAGCELLLFSPDLAGTLESLKRKTRIINLSQVPEFEDLFIDNLYLRPIKGSRQGPGGEQT